MYQKLIGILFIVWIGLPSFFAAAQDDLVAIANQANMVYTTGDTETAIDLYESLIAAGVRDTTVYFNLANAYYAQQNFGEAILNYRRAQIIDPRDPDLNANLSLVRARRIDLQGDETPLVDSLTALTAGILTLIELSWLVALAWIVFFALLIVSITRTGWRDAMRVPLVVVGILVLAGFGLLGSRLYTNSVRPAAVAVQEVVAVMSGPGDEYLLIDELHTGAEMRLLEQRGEWIRFVLPDGRQGWARVETIAIV